MNKIHSKYLRILAIAPSTRGFGFAVLEGQDTLADWGVKSVTGNKNTNSVAKVKELITHYQPDVLVLQDVEAKGSRRASRIRTLNRQVKAMAEKRKIEVKLISGKQLRGALLGDPRGTKQEMAEMLAMRFRDELASRLPPKRKPWQSEDSRMDIFDAMELAVVFRMNGVR